MAVGCITGFNIPGVKGSLSISHSALGSCPTPANNYNKVVKKDIYGSFSFEDLHDGITINVFFSEANKFYNDTLNLQIEGMVNGQGDPVKIPIISKMLDEGSGPVSGESNVELRGASFSYPKQDDYSIVTFVYQPLKCQIDTGAGGIVDYHTTPWYVQQAIGVQSVPLYKGSLGTDFNNFKAEGTYPINFNKTNSFITSDSQGILEVIRTDMYVIQRATQADGTMFQRFCIEENNSDVQSSQQAITSTIVS